LTLLERTIGVAGVALGGNSVKLNTKTFFVFVLWKTTRTALFRLKYTTEHQHKHCCNQAHGVPTCVSNSAIFVEAPSILAMASFLFEMTVRYSLKL
jgi:hypothetical protein